MNIIRARIFIGKYHVGKYWFVKLDIITIQIIEILRYFLWIRIGNNCKRYIHGGFYQRRGSHNLGNQNFLGKNQTFTATREGDQRGRTKEIRLDERTIHSVEKKSKEKTQKRKRGEGEKRKKGKKKGEVSHWKWHLRGMVWASSSKKLMIGAPSLQGR